MTGRIFGWTTASLFALAAIIGACFSLRWPLMGDTIYMHYALRLIHHGFRPYADVIEMNMPGSYLLEALAIKVFAAGSLMALKYNPPQSLIITDSVCFGGARTFDKYESWPAFQSLLEQKYRLSAEHHPQQLEHYWSRRTMPFAWRVYTKLPAGR